MAASQYLLLVACMRATLTGAVEQDLSNCAEPRAQLETAVALVSSLEKQLKEATQRVIVKQLNARSCELGLKPVASQRSSEAAERNGQIASDAGNRCPCEAPHTV